MLGPRPDVGVPTHHSFHPDVEHPHPDLGGPFQMLCPHPDVVSSPNHCSPHPDVGGGPNPGAEVLTQMLRYLLGHQGAPPRCWGPTRTWTSHPTATVPIQMFRLSVKDQCPHPDVGAPPRCWGPTWTRPSHPTTTVPTQMWGSPSRCGRPSPNHHSPHPDVEVPPTTRDLPSPPTPSPTGPCGGGGGSTHGCP